MLEVLRRKEKWYGTNGQMTLDPTGKKGSDSQCLFAQALCLSSRGPSGWTAETLFPDSQVFSPAHLDGMWFSPSCSCWVALREMLYIFSKGACTYICSQWILKFRRWRACWLTKYVCLGPFVAPPRQRPPPPVAVGSRSRVDSGVWICESLVFLDPKHIYRAQDLQSKRVFF